MNVKKFHTYCGKKFWLKNFILPFLREVEQMLFLEVQSLRKESIYKLSLKKKKVKSII